MARRSARARQDLMNVRPSITGMFQSTSAMSGINPPSSRASASAPSPAWTTSNPSPVMRRVRIARIARESSTTSACMVILLGQELLVDGRVRAGQGLSGGGGLQIEQGPGIKGEQQLLRQGVGPDQERTERRIDGGRCGFEGHLVDLLNAADLVDQHADRLVVHPDHDVD